MANLRGDRKLMRSSMPTANPRATSGGRHDMGTLPRKIKLYGNSHSHLDGGLGSPLGALSNVPSLILFSIHSGTVTFEKAEIVRRLASVHKTYGSVTCARNWELLLPRAYCKRSGSGS
jgi:hypothetical protein